MSAEVETKKEIVVEEKKSLLAEESKNENEKDVSDSTKKTSGEDEKVGTDGEKESSSQSPPPPPPRVHKTDFQNDVVYLYQFSRTPLLPSLSPFCFKVETWLRLNDVKYENVDHKLKLKSCKGQLPFVELNGEEIADSALIISKLGQHFGCDSDAQLTKDEKNVSHALISMIENHLCWVYVYWRSKNPDAMIKGFKLSLQHALGSRIPNVLLNVFFKLTYSRKGAKKVKAHGLGVHSPEEVLEFGKQDLKVLEETIGDKEFFFGDKPSNLDVVAFSHLCQIFYVDKTVDYELRDWMTENCPSLVGLINRLKERCFPDWDNITTTLGMNTHIPEENKDVGRETNEKETKEKESPAKEGGGGEVIEKEKEEAKKEDEK